MGLSPFNAPLCQALWVAVNVECRLEGECRSSQLRQLLVHSVCLERLLQRGDYEVALEEAIGDRVHVVLEGKTCTHPTHQHRNRVVGVIGVVVEVVGVVFVVVLCTL